MALPYPGGGLRGGVKVTQVVPSHSHVSCSHPLESAPPKSTTRWRRASYAIAALERATGLTGVAIRVQFAPSHSQVCGYAMETLAVYVRKVQKRTARRRAMSKAMTASAAGGGAVAGAVEIQRVPSHSQVSLSASLVES